MTALTTLAALTCAAAAAAVVLLVGGPPPGSMTPRRARRRPAVSAVARPTASAAGAPPVPEDPLVDAALVLDLAAAAVRAGTPPRRALVVAASAVGGVLSGEVAAAVARLDLGTESARAWPAFPRPALEAVATALSLAEAGGGPAVDLLTRAAARLRRERRRGAEEDLARLGVRLLLPVGLCWLPAAGLLGVAPVVLGLAGRVLG